MKRKFERLLEGHFDLLVIGGGIYGAWVAYDAAMRGLRVAVCEQEDWASGTSSASSKLIHGGLRYLEQRHLRLVRTSLEERRRLVALGPHRVQPLRFALPVYAGQRPGRFLLKAGLWLYDRLGGRDQPVAPHEALSLRDMRARYPFLRAERLKGGFTYGDCWNDDARFVVELLSGAVHFGAAAVNRARVTRLTVEGSRVVGAEVLDRETEATLKLRASFTVNCAGPWIDRLGEVPGAAPTPVRLSKGVHLVMPALPTDDAFLLPASDGRIVFLIPWYGRTLLGTTDTDYRGSPASARAEPRDVAYLLREANRFLGDHYYEEPDVIGSFAGLRVLPASDDPSPYTVSREWFMVEPLEGLLTSVGGKYTSARADAARMVDRVLERLGREPVPCPTAERPLPWSPGEPFEDFRAATISRGLTFGLDEETAAAAAGRYGRQVDALFEVLAERPGLVRRIVPDAPFCMAEALIAVRDEMARTLADVVRRRIPLVLVSRPDRGALDALAMLIGEPLRWSPSRRAAEVEAVLHPHRSGAPAVRP